MAERGQAPLCPSGLLKIKSCSSGSCLLRSLDEISDQADVCKQGADLRERVGPPYVGNGALDAAELHQCADHAHEGTTGDETTGDERALFATLLVDGSIFRASCDKPVDGATHQ